MSSHTLLCLFLFTLIPLANGQFFHLTLYPRVYLSECWNVLGKDQWLSIGCNWSLQLNTGKAGSFLKMCNGWKRGNPKQNTLFFFPEIFANDILISKYNWECNIFTVAFQPYHTFFRLYCMINFSATPIFKVLHEVGLLSSRDMAWVAWKECVMTTVLLCCCTR